MPNSPIPAEKSRSRQSHLAAVRSLDVYRHACLTGFTQRTAAKLAGVPRMTLEDRCQSNPTPFHNKVWNFLETPEGSEFLNSLVLSVAMGFVVSAGVGLPTFLCWLKEFCLDTIFASSYGTWRAIISQMERSTCAIAQEESQRLSKNVENKKVTIGLDETWLTRMCLVCAEMESGFLLFESYQDKRDAETWSQVWRDKVATYGLDPIQAVADAGTGIRGFLAGTLQAHRSPDLFHIEHDVCKALARFLARKEQNIKDAVTERQTKYEELKQLQCEEQKIVRVGRPVDFKKYLAEARGVMASAHRELKFIRRERDNFKELLKRMSSIYQPVTQTGTRKSASLLERELKELFTDIYSLANRVKLPSDQIRFIEKAERQTQPMIDTLKFFSKYAGEQVDAYTPNASLGYLIHAYLIPAAVLKRQINRLSGLEAGKVRERVSQLRRIVLDRLKDDSSIKEMENLAKKVASFWQRSSSAIEGRNGLLSYRHHGLRGISEAKLACLTVLHNFYSRRRDGTTAAERFFQAPHANIFKEAIRRSGEIPRAYRKQKKEHAA